MKKNYLRMICVTLAILVLSIMIAILSVTALDGDEIAVTSDEYEEVFTPLSSEGGLIEDEIPSMCEITMGDIIGPSSPVAPDAITTEEIPDGVYALKNVGNTNRWMDMEQNHVEPGKHIQQYAYSSSPATAFSRAGLFKISKKPGTTNLYIIRSMLNNRLSFEIKNNQVVTKEIPADDNDVSLLDTFTITYNTNGYVIQPRGSSNAVCAPNTTASGGSSSYLIKSTLSEAGNRAKWVLEPYTGANQSGASFLSPAGLSMGLVEGKVYSVKGYSWTTLINVNKLLLEVPYSYVDTASSVWYDNTETMRLTLHKAGKFRIYIYIYNENEYDPTDPNDTPARSFYGNYMSVPPIEDGEKYFIRNEGTKRYMDVEGPSTAEGAIIQQWSFSTATQKKWIFTRESGGYFTIKSAYSNKYVGVDSTNTSVIRQYGTKSDYTLWYFVGTDSDNYSLHCKASAVTGVLALPSVTSGNGENLRIYAYTNDADYRDEWLFVASIIKIRIIADNAYRTRYTTWSSKLTDSMSEIQLRFLQYFGVLIEYSNPSAFSSYGDTCDENAGTTYLDGCSHAGDSACKNSSFSSVGNADQELHHKNMYNIMYRITFPNIDENTLLVFSGHDVCRIQDDKHKGRYNGLAWSDYGIALITNFGTSDSEKRTIIHEIGHWYGAPDHYDIGDIPSTTEIQQQTGDSRFNSNCIYGENKSSQNVVDNLIICDGCKARIIENIRTFSHEDS